jgi:hypothetical protein
MHLVMLTGAILSGASSQVSAQQPKPSSENTALGDERANERADAILTDLIEQVYRQFVESDQNYN